MQSRRLIQIPNQKRNLRILRNTKITITEVTVTTARNIIMAAKTKMTTTMGAILRPPMKICRAILLPTVRQRLRLLDMIIEATKTPVPAFFVLK